MVENNADFQPWFGFSSSQRTDLMYARVNNTDVRNLGGFRNARVATGGAFARRDRVIEVALTWADIAAVVAPSRQPGGDLVAAIQVGFTFGNEPLLISNDYDSQAFIGPDPWRPGSGMDQYSREIRLIDAEVIGMSPAPVLDISWGAVGVEISWSAAVVGYVLETMAVLGGAGSWAAARETPVLSNDRYVVTIQPAAVAAFYRLRR